MNLVWPIKLGPRFVWTIPQQIVSLENGALTGADSKERAIDNRHCIYLWCWNFINSFRMALSTRAASVSLWIKFWYWIEYLLQIIFLIERSTMSELELMESEAAFILMNECMHMRICLKIKEILKNNSQNEMLIILEGLKMFFYQSLHHHKHVPACPTGGIGVRCIQS